MSVREQLAERIRMHREELGLSQEQLAGMLGLSRPSISLMESARREVSSTELARLSEIFGVSSDVLLSSGPEVSWSGAPRSPRVPKFDKGKFKQVLLYVLERCGARPNVGETVIYKLLYFIDFNFYELYEQHLTGETYRKIKFGPAPCHFKEVANEMLQKGEIKRLTTNYYGKPQKKYIPQIRADLGKFNGRELEVVDSVLDRLCSMNASSIEHYSHEDIPWQVSDDNEVIDYESVFYRRPAYSVREYPQE